MSAPERHLSPTAALLAWLWPGLGHLSLGQRRRGLLIMSGVLFLFVSGLLIGGIDVVDLRRDRLWFLAQGFCGPIAFAANFANQRLVARPPEDWRSDAAWKARYQDADNPDPDILAQLEATSIGKVNEIGTLYVALAGLMNLVVILDALNSTPRPRSGPA